MNLSSTPKSLIASVIIPAKNAERSLDECLSAIQSQSVSRAAYEIILVDDASTDRTSQIAEKYKVIVLDGMGKGSAAARNTGAKFASAPICVFTDADCSPASDWLEWMLKPLSDPSISGVKGAYLTRQKEITARFVQLEYEAKYARMSRYPFIDFIDTYSAAFRRDIFMKLGGFDESFPGASVEDQEFSFRMAEAGHKMIFQPNARVYHLHANNPLAYSRKKYKIGYWKIKVLRQHTKKILNDTHTPQSLKLQIPVFYLFLISLFTIPWTGWVLPPAAGAVFLGLGWPEIGLSIRQGKIIVTFCSIFFMMLRSGALGLGLFRGILKRSPSV